MGCRTGFDPVLQVSQTWVLSHHTHDTIHQGAMKLDLGWKLERTAPRSTWAQYAFQQRTYTIPPVFLRTLPTCIAGVFGFPRLDTFAVVFTRLSAWLSALARTNSNSKNEKPCYLIEVAGFFVKLSRALSCYLRLWFECATHAKAHRTDAIPPLNRGRILRPIQARFR